MKKTVLITIILTALLLLSGCDAMLEIFYPEFADNYDGNLVLDINYTISDFHYGVLTGSDQPIKMIIYYPGDSPYSGADPAFFDYQENPKISYEQSDWFTSYLDLNSDYDIWLWCDHDDDGSVSSGDFITKNPIEIISSDEGDYKYVELIPEDFESIE